MDANPFGTFGGVAMKTVFRIQNALLKSIHVDLSRPHPFAHERVGFIACRVGGLPEGQVLLADSYCVVADEDYENDPSVGAMMGSGAIRKALQFSYSEGTAMFHVHRHEHKGKPGFSKIDISEGGKFVPDFWNVNRSMPHGMIVLSKDSMTGAWWDPKNKQTQYIDEMVVIGRVISNFGGKP